MAKAIPLEELPVYSKSNLPSPHDDFQSGCVFLIDKPLEATSFNMVQMLRRLINVKKVGHAGTLDPLADGMLILCAGKGTKSISQIQEMAKTYRVEITLGATTPSLDRATEVEEEAEFAHVTREELEKVIEQQFTGTIEQYPPMFSAVKVDGERLYKKARKGETVERKSRNVTVYGVEVLNFDLPRVELNVHCSKGTYIRTLAYDLGKALDSLGYVSQLRRTAIGNFTVGEALEPEDLKSIFETHGQDDVSQ